jgi:C1A family cysteine protease
MIDVKELSFDEIEFSLSKSPALDDIEDPRDFLYDEIMGAGEIPENFMLEGLTPSKSQGVRGTCVGFTATAISEHFNAKEYENPNLDLSEEYMFARIKQIDIADYNYSGYGAHLRSGAKALRTYGACLESLAPYQNTNNEKEWQNFVFTPKKDNDAKKYKVKSYLQVTKDKESIKRALFQSKAHLSMGVTLYESYRRGANNNAVLPIPKSGERVIGGHNMALAGYTRDHMIFKNSWGDWGGAKGLLYLPWGAMHTVFPSIWSFVDLKLNQYVSPEKLIEFNKSFLEPHQVEDWEKAIKKGGLITPGTRPDHVLTKGDFMVFLGRVGLL